MRFIPKPGDTLTLVITTLDTPSTLSDDDDLVYDDVNIHIYGANVYYGMGDVVVRATQGAATPNCSTATTGAVLSFRNLRVSTMKFKSFAAATPGTVVATGTILNAPG